MTLFHVLVITVDHDSIPISACVCMLCTILFCILIPTVGHDSLMFVHQYYYDIVCISLHVCMCVCVHACMTLYNNDSAIILLFPPYTFACFY